MFILNKYNEYEMEVNGIRFICETIKDGLEETVAILANAYENRVGDIVNYMIENGLSDIFGELHFEQVVTSLGKVTIDLDRKLIMYLEQTFDYTHIIEVEYGGVLDEFFYFNIDG